MDSITVRAYLKVLEDFKKNTKDANELAIYEDTTVAIKEYVRDRHLGFGDQDRAKIKLKNPSNNNRLKNR